MFKSIVKIAGNIIKLFLMFVGAVTCVNIVYMFRHENAADSDSAELKDSMSTNPFLGINPFETSPFMDEYHFGYADNGVELESDEISKVDTKHKLDKDWMKKVRRKYIKLNNKGSNF